MSDAELSKYLAGTMTKATAQELSEMTYDELIEKYLKDQYKRKAGEDYDEELCRQYVAQHKEEQKQMLTEALPFYKEQIKAMKSVDMTIYKEVLAQFKSVLPQDIENPTDAEIEAICNMYGLTAEQIYTMTQNRNSSPMIIKPNSGFVEVVKPGTGFDECEQGMLEYFEGRGWRYGCTGGGVSFGEAEGLKLTEVEKIEVPANAYTVIPVNAIQLDKDGNGVVEGAELDGMKMIKTDKTTGTQSFVSAKDAGVTSIDLSSYNAKNIKQANGNTLAGNYNLNVSGKKVEGYQTLDQMDWLAANYGNSYGKSIDSTEATSTAQKTTAAATNVATLPTRLFMQSGVKSPTKSSRF